MRDQRRPTAIVPRSLLLGATQRTTGNRVAGKGFMAEGRVGSLAARGCAFGLVGNFQFWGGTPETLEIVVAASLIAKDMNDEAAEIEQSPFGGAMTFAVLGRAAHIFVELLFHLGADRLHLRGAVAGADDEIFRERTDAAEVEDGNTCCFFGLRGLDGEAHALWQGFEFHRYRPCLRMYSSTRAETSP